MEKAILKTLIYADIFDYPLKAYEIHKWLIGRKVSLRQVEKALGRLSKKIKVKSKKDYFFLPGRVSLVSIRQQRGRQSSLYFKKLQFIMPFLKLIPSIKLIGISGGLAMENADKKDDIDLFIVTAKNRLWISRLLTLGFLSLIGQRRQVKDKDRKIAGKLCLNILLEEDKLSQDKRDIYVAHEVLQMRVLWQRGGIYSKYLLDNEWAFKFLPNWIGDNFFETSLRGGRKSKRLSSDEAIFRNRLPRSQSSLAMTALENLAKKFQLKIMKSPKGMERIEEGALYFHPQDCRERILAEYKHLLRRNPLLLAQNVKKELKNLAPLDKVC